MANEDSTRQINVDGQVLNELVTVVRELSTRYTSQEERLSSVEQIILARLNDTRPFEKQLIAQLNEMNNKISELSVGQAAMREEQAAMRADFSQFRQETNQNFRIVSKKLALLNEDFLSNRAEYALVEKRVEDIESRAA